MTIAEIINYGVRLLSTESGTSRLDTEVLLCDALSCDRAWLISHPEFKLTQSIERKVITQLKRRSVHEPLAYIRQKVEFYNLDFHVDKRVLVPRPESEAIIEFLLSIVQNIKYQASNLNIIDVGTGSGALIITAALEMSKLQNRVPKASYYAIDIDKDCLDLARKNSKQHKTDVIFLEGNLLEPILPHIQSSQPETLLIIANLPYVPDTYSLNDAAMNEPRQAIFGGKDGLDLYRQLFKQLTYFTSKALSTVVITESLPFQHSKLVQIAMDHGFKLLKVDNFIQVFH